MGRPSVVNGDLCASLGSEKKGLVLIKQFNMGCGQSSILAGPQVVYGTVIGEGSHDELAQERKHDDASDTKEASSFKDWSTATARASTRVGKDVLAGRLKQNVVVMRPETREFYQHLETFFELKQSIEGVVAKVMPGNALHKYEDIKPPTRLKQACVPEGDLLTQLDVLYLLADEAKPIFDDFGRNLVQQIGLEPDKAMLDQAERTWCTYTAVPLKKRDTAMQKAQNECGGDARRLVDVVRASVVVDTESAFEAVVKCLNENYVATERDGVRVVRFKNRCKKPLADGQRDVQYNISVMLPHCSSRFICELQIHMKQILDYKEATHVPYEYFRSYFKGGDAKVVEERVVLFEKFAGRDIDDISQIVTSALMGHDQDQLDALAELFEKLSELEIVVLIRRRLLQLARSHKSFSFFFKKSEDWRRLAASGSKLASALKEQAKYDEAKPLYERSLRIRETNLGEHHPDVATSLNNLANLLHHKGKYDEAKPLYERSLRIQETNLGEHHPDVAYSLNNLAILLKDQGKYDEAKPLYERSLRIYETNLGEHHLDVATTLNNLAILFKDQGKYDEAKPIYERSLRIRETNLGKHHPDVATSLNNLAVLLYHKGKYDEAKPLYERSLRIRETNLGEHHPDVATSLNNLAVLLYHKGKYDEAKPLYERSLLIRETNLGEHHHLVAYSLTGLANLLQQQGKYKEAEPLYERSLQIRETNLGEHHPVVAYSLTGLASLHQDQGKYYEAKPLYERSLRIRETNLGEHHPLVAHSLTGLATLLQDQGEYDKAKPLHERSLRIRETHLGAHHPDVATSLGSLATLLQDQGKYEEAKPLYERSLRIRETNFGEHHPDVATSLNNLASLLSQQGKKDEAKPLYERSLRIQETNR